MRNVQWNIILGLLLIGITWQGNVNAAETDYTNRIIIKFAPQTGEATASAQRKSAQSLTQRRLSLLKRMAGNREVYSLDQTMTVAAVRSLAQELMQHEDIIYAEPDLRRYPKFVPGDAAYANQWYLYETAGGINAERAWDITRGDSATVIAVLDTGILQHSDISRVLGGYDFIASDRPGVFTTANDGDGRDSDPSDPGDAAAAGECGFNSPATESIWHGTIITGMLVANTDPNSRIGIAALDHNAFVLPLRVLGKCGGYISDIADAIRWAAGLAVPGVPDNPNPADVINLSLGSNSACSNIEQDAIDAATLAGAVVVAAAGNENIPTVTAPANCNNVIAVAATTRRGGRACYTNFGFQVDISAPGGNDNDLFCSGNQTDGIFVTSNAGTSFPTLETYEYVIGTSFATPMVSGAVALINAIAPELTFTSIRALLQNTARAFPLGTNDSAQDCNTVRCGAGILDIAAAVTTASAGAAIDATPANFNFTARNNVPLNTNIQSNSITVQDIDVPASISISGGEYAIANGSFTTEPGTVLNGQNVVVRVKSAADFNSDTLATLTIGRIRANFTVTTEASPNNNDGGGGGGAMQWPLIMLLLFAFFLIGRRNP